MNLWPTSTCLPSFLGGGLVVFSSVQDESSLIPAQHAKEGYWIELEHHKQIVQLVKQLGGGGVWGVVICGLTLK